VSVGSNKGHHLVVIKVASKALLSDISNFKHFVIGFIEEPSSHFEDMKNVSKQQSEE
jgi:hypothetical protein